MDKKAIFLDLDGTLLTDDKSITEGNRTAIGQALERGHKVVIATGRPLTSAIQQAELLGLTEQGCYLISFNGGIIYDMGNRAVLSSAGIPLEVVWRVFDEANRQGVHIQTYDREKVLVEPRCDNASVRRYCEIIHVEFGVVDSVKNLVEKPTKMLLINYEDGSALGGMTQWLQEHEAETLDSFYSCASYVEIVPRGINKGWAILELATKMGIAPENTIAVGDTANDYTMIQTAGVGVAMQNGTDEVKAVADYITERDNNHSGVAEVIQRFML